MNNITAVYVNLVGHLNYAIEQDLEEFEDTHFNRVEIYYDWVDDDEEGDSYRYDYYIGDNLVGYVENLGGDECDGELTAYGKQVMFEQHIKAYKKLLSI